MRFTILLLSVSLLVLQAAKADENSVAAVSNKRVQEECGACHMAFQPVFLPAASWRKIMRTLDDHFGEDASLGAGPRDEIEAYLVANAGRGRVDNANPPIRITGLNWFRGEHREGKIKWLRKKRNLKTMVDCAACHRGAERGYFEDD